MSRSQGVTYLLSNVGGKVGAVDGMIGASTSTNATGAIAGTITAVGSGASMFPGPVGQLGTAVTVGITLGKNGGDPRGLTLGDVLTVGAGVAALAGAPVVALGLTVAGLGYTIFKLNNPSFDPTLGDLLKLHPDNFRQDEWGNPDNFLGDFKDKANRDGKYHIVDPLVLDLDGDGIETVGAQGRHGALFDHNKDGIRTATGWVSADDGLLVIDRNSDGLINNGSELFGDNTALKDGSNAEHGYAALKELDINSDGLVDAQDEAFQQLRVWRDLNQDGISQEGELFTLESLNIQSLNTAYQDANTRLGNGNSLAQKGSYTLSDGQTREMGDILLANDTLHSRYIEPVKLTDAQLQAPNLQGIGRLRDLREAAALSPALAA